MKSRVGVHSRFFPLNWSRNQQSPEESEHIIPFLGLDHPLVPTAIPGWRSGSELLREPFALGYRAVPGDAADNN